MPGSLRGSKVLDRMIVVNVNFVNNDANRGKGRLAGAADEPGGWVVVAFTASTVNAEVCSGEGKGGL